MLLLQVLLLLLLPLQLAPSSQPLCPAPPFSGLLLSQPEVGFCSPQPELPVSMPELPGPPPQPANTGKMHHFLSLYYLILFLIRFIYLFLF